MSRHYQFQLAQMRALLAASEYWVQTAVRAQHRVNQGDGAPWGSPVVSAAGHAVLGTFQFRHHARCAVETRWVLARSMLLTRIQAQHFV